MRRFNEKIVLCAFLLVAFPVMVAFGQQGEAKSVITERRLVRVAPGKLDKCIEVNAHDMLQIQPFSYPVSPKFLDAKIKVELKGSQVLEAIGQTTAPVFAEGRAGASVFFFVHTKGNVDILLTLTRGEDNVEIPGYRVSYSVKSSE